MVLQYVIIVKRKERYRPCFDPLGTRKNEPNFGIGLLFQWFVGRGLIAMRPRGYDCFFILERSIQFGFPVWTGATPDGSCVRLLFRHSHTQSLED
jgi:hypothetical protein